MTLKQRTAKYRAQGHLKYAYFSIYNHELDSVEIYRSRTLPFGATHSVYSFLRLAKMLHFIACKGPRLLTTNFYDDFILASGPDLQILPRIVLSWSFCLLVGNMQGKERKQPPSRTFVRPWEFRLTLGSPKMESWRLRTLRSESLT